MDPNNFVAPYLTDPRDRAALGAMPTVMVPRFGALPELEVGHRRYLAGAGGLYLEARSRVVHACMLMGELSLPYGQVEPFVRITGGEVDENMIDKAKELAAEACPSEWAGLVRVNPQGDQELWVPQGSEASAHRVSYNAAEVDPLSVVLDVHSHGRLDAFWSGTDDRDDLANPSPAFFSAVIGNADTPDPTLCVRLVVAGRFFVLKTANQLDS